MLPWSLRWRAWVQSQRWIYLKLWRNHKIVIFLACLGLAFLLRLVVGHWR
jgi:hypothetical protein